MNNVAMLVVLFCAYPIMALTAQGVPPQKPIWIDVRTVQEYESGHLPGARNISFDHIGERISEITTNKNAAIRLYCQSGRRSGVAKQTLEKLGYVNVVNAGGVKRVLRKAATDPVIEPGCATASC